MSRDLARIMFDAPVDLNKIPDFHFDLDQVVAGLKKLEFNSLIRKVNAKVLENNAFEEPLKRGVSTGAAEPHDEGSEGAFRESNISSIAKSSFRDSAIAKPNDFDGIIDWDIKGLMHSDQAIAAEILSQKKSFWDLGQAAFLLNPLSREEPHLSDFTEEYQHQYEDLKNSPRLLSIYQDFDLPLIPVLYKMEKRGMALDPDYFKKLKIEYEEIIKSLEQEIYEIAGQEFNLNSPIQLSDVLFGKLQLPTKGIKKTTRGYSTGAKELDKLQELHPIIPKIIEYREAAKLLNTYIIPLPELADSDNRVHTTFTQNVTATGRLSSKDPNLQNIPVRTDAGKRIRQGFIAEKGKVFVSADYSQFELRLAAILAGDQSLIDDFNNGIDIHTKTASEIFDIPIDQVTKSQRRAAKAINFGIIYGMSITGLSEATHMNFTEAKQFMENYRKLRAPVMQYMDSILKQAREQGFVETYFGRRRPTPDVKSSNFLIRQAAERAAQNMPIQGTEADLMKRAMIHIDKLLPKNADLVMQIHDSLIVECDEKDAKTVASILKTEMETIAPELKIKLAVDVTTGHNWGEL